MATAKSRRDNLLSCLGGSMAVS